jgi:hypothetical protein
MKTYSFLDIQCAIAGPGLVANLSAGVGQADEGITFAFNGNINTTTIGADGEGMNTLRSDRSGTVTVRLLKSSPTNQILSAALAFQRTSSAAHGQNTITLFDRNKGDVVTAEGVAFNKVPDLNFGKEAQVIEWQFSAVKISPTLGS